MKNKNDIDKNIVIEKNKNLPDIQHQKKEKENKQQEQQNQQQ